jgi:REP element-mobilizing transposase RayT
MTQGLLRYRRRSIRLPEYDYAQAGAYFVTLCTHNREPLFGDIVDGEMALNEFGEIVHRCWTALPGHFSHVCLDAFVVMPNHLHGVIIIARTNGADRTDHRNGEGLAKFTETPVHEGSAHWDEASARFTYEPVRGRGARRGEALARGGVEIPSTGGANASPLQPSSLEKPWPNGTRPGSLAAMVQNFKSVSTRAINRLRGETGLPVWQRNYYEHIIRDERDLDRIRQYIADNPGHWAEDAENPVVFAREVRRG